MKKYSTNMDENYCFMCQESNIGHTTKTCPQVKCRNCDQKGHTLRMCPKLNPDPDESTQKLDSDPQGNLLTFHLKVKKPKD